MISSRFIHSGVQCIAVAVVSAFLIGQPTMRAGAQDDPGQHHPSLDKAFLAENNTVMQKMMRDMTVRPSGDVDHDFVAMMVPHHQGAIDMAQAELRYGYNEQLRRIAQEIIVDQMQEIAAMRLALGQPLPPSIASPTQPSPGSKQGTTSRGSMTVSHPMIMHEEH